MSKKMITMVPVDNSLIVARPVDPKPGERVTQVSPPAGKPFAFTEEELADIKRLSPKAVRAPVNESKSVEEEDEDDGDEASEITSVATPADEPEEPASKPKASKAKAPSKDDDDL
jgi:hypothetical protein